MTVIKLGKSTYHGLVPDDDPIYTKRGWNFLTGKNRNWMWTITARDYPRSIHSRGNSPTREEAMKDFKTQWLTTSQPT